MTTDWNALLGLTTYVVTLDGWPRDIPVSASSVEGAIAKARNASFATTEEAKWRDAAATAVTA